MKKIDPEIVKFIGLNLLYPSILPERTLGRQIDKQRKLYLSLEAIRYKGYICQNILRWGR